MIYIILYILSYLWQPQLQQEPLESESAAPLQEEQVFADGQPIHFTPLFLAFLI